MKKFFFLFMLSWITFCLNAQRAVKEVPPSFVYEQVAKSKLQSAQKLEIPFKVDALIAEDAKLEGLGFPVRIAKTIPAKFTPENAGEWTTLPDGKHIWRLEIDAPDATAVSLLYDKFIIPYGGKLFIYDVDYKVVNTYTSSDNPKRQEYSTDFIPGDKIRMEYWPAAGVDGFQLVISGVSYAYKDVIASLEAKANEAFSGMEPRSPAHVGASESCEVNVNCSEGADWYHQQRGVAATVQVIGNNSYLCSGTVVNNALQDRTPYFLMAYHCGGEATAADFNRWSFYFFFERTGCENTSPLKEYKLITGATSKVAIPLNGASDGLLLQLNQSIPTEWDVYFNGWDRRNAATAGGAGIHHPQGDVKKISTYTQTPISSTANMTSGERGASNAHWSMAFVATAHGHGVTEGGSSGSPLFNSAKRVIGTLTGGSSTCANPNASNIYGKMSWHWNQSSNPDLHMSKFLDPNNSGIEFIDGTYAGDPYKVTFTAGKTSIWASEEITFVNHSYGDIDTYEWDFGSNAVPAAYTGQNPPSAVLYNTAGNYSVKLTAKKSGNIVDVFEMPIKVTLKENYCPQTPVTIGNPASTTTAPFPLGMDTTYAGYSLSAAIYTAAELNIGANGMITDLEWEAKNVSATNRTLTVYLKETDASDFASATTWSSEISGLTPVYTGTLSIAQAGVVKIHLTNPFICSGTKNIKVLVRAYAAFANTNSQCVYTATETNTHQQWTDLLSEPTTAGKLNANRPNLKVYYDEPCGAAAPVANFSLSATTINQGESVTITDLSTGPVVTYKWSLPGGIPSSGSEAAPTVRYMTAGVYDITLDVINSLGTDTKRVSGAVTVNVHTPEPDFASYSNGFIKASDLGPFLPLTGGPVRFENQSKHYPTSIQWSFPGATPSSSTEGVQLVSYPAGETKYSVSLNGTNAAGTGNTTKTDYVQLGGTAGIWNVSFGEEPKYIYRSGSSGVTGADLFTKTAERFEAPAGGEVSNIRILTANVAQRAGSNMTVQLFSDNGGVPGTAISEELIIEGGKIVNNGFNTLTFTNPVPVSGVFHVVVGSTNYMTTYFIVPCVLNRASKYSTVSAYYSNTWRDLGSLTGLYTSMNIVPEFTYTTAELSSPLAYKKKDIDATPETITFTTSGRTWTAKADEWINLSAATGSISGGSGSLTFTVSDNTMPDIRRGTIMLNVAGHESEIYVTQTGARPTDLTAELNNKGEIQIGWKHEIPPAPATTPYPADLKSYTKVKPGASQSALAEKIQNIDPEQIRGIRMDETGSTENAPAFLTLNDMSAFGKKMFAIHSKELKLNSEDRQQLNDLRASNVEEVSLKWHNGAIAFINGNEDGGLMEAAVRFAPVDLPYDKATLKAVEFYTFNPCKNLTIIIRQGNRIIHSQLVGDITQKLQLHRVTLNLPVVIDASEDLYVGYQYDQYAGSGANVFVPISDRGPAVVGKGNLFSENGGAFKPGATGNWLITAHLELAPMNITFNVYRNGNRIAEGVAQKSYVDAEDLQPNTYSYTVTAVYGDPKLESAESDPVVIRKGTRIDKINFEKPLKVYPNPSRPGANFYLVANLNEAELKDAYIEVYNIVGSLIRKVKVTGKETEMSLPQSGTYLLRLNGEEILFIVR